MPVVRGILVAFATALLLAAAAYGPAPANQASLASVSQTLPAASANPELQESADRVWARIPHCNCLATFASDNVANALKNANLTVSLKELSPRDGWLYFVVTFDPHSATSDQVSAAIVTGGGQVLDGPP